MIEPYLNEQGLTIQQHQVSYKTNTRQKCMHTSTVSVDPISLGLD